jgi:hypothetical protein
MHHFPELTNEPTETPLWVKLIPAVQVAIPVSAPSGPEYAFAKCHCRYVVSSRRHGTVHLATETHPTGFSLSSSRCAMRPMSMRRRDRERGDQR